MKLHCLVVLLAAALLGGCTTKARSKARAREAFLAGQQQGMAQVNEARRINIRFLGPVRHQEVLWEDGLTLIQAIAAAEYAGDRDPGVIAIVRQSGRIPVAPREVLAGRDVPLEPGDTIEIRP